jgi:hypothetical protein
VQSVQPPSLPSGPSARRLGAPRAAFRAPPRPARPTLASLMLLVAMTALAAATVFLLEDGEAGPGGSNGLLALLLILVALIPAGVYAIGARRGTAEPVPFLPLIGLLFAAYYGLPYFSEQIRWIVPGVELGAALAETLRGTLLGLVMLLLGYYLLGPVVDAALPVLSFDIRYERAVWYGWLLTAVGFLSTQALDLYFVPTRIKSIVDFLASLFFVGIALLVLLQCRGRLPPRHALALDAVAIPVFLLMQLGTGFTTGVGTAIVSLALICWSQASRVSVAVAVLGLVLAFMVRGGATGAFRQEVWYGGTTGQRWELGLRHLQLTYELWTGGGDTTLEESQEGLANRIGYLNTFAYVAYTTPRQIPYLDGASYEALLVSPIPRVIWPDKPQKELGQSFPHRYGLLDPWDTTTSFNLPYIVELYINSGWFGVLTGMFIIGVVYRVVNALVNRPFVPAGTILIGVIVLSNLLAIEIDLNLLFGNIFLKLVSYVVALSPVLVWVSMGQLRDRA